MKCLTRGRRDVRFHATTVLYYLRDDKLQSPGKAFFVQEPTLRQQARYLVYVAKFGETTWEALGSTAGFKQVSFHKLCTTLNREGA